MSTMQMSQEDHPVHNIPDPTESYRELQRATESYKGVEVADVTPLHPPGTFSSNTQKGDALNGVAKALGVSLPANVVRFSTK